MSERIVWRKGMVFREKGKKPRYEILSIVTGGIVSWGVEGEDFIKRREYIVDFAQHFSNGDRVLVEPTDKKENQ